MFINSFFFFYKLNFKFKYFYLKKYFLFFTNINFILPNISNFNNNNLFLIKKNLFIFSKCYNIYFYKLLFKHLNTLNNLIYYFYINNFNIFFLDNNSSKIYLPFFNTKGFLKKKNFFFFKFNLNFLKNYKFFKLFKYFFKKFKVKLIFLWKTINSFFFFKFFKLLKINLISICNLNTNLLFYNNFFFILKKTNFLKFFFIFYFFNIYKISLYNKFIIKFNFYLNKKKSLLF